MKLSEQRNLGQTKTKAFSLSNQGFVHHVITPIGQARPKMTGVEYRATPIDSERVTLYSFSSPEDCLAFINAYGGEALRP